MEYQQEDDDLYNIDTFQAILKSATSVKETSHEHAGINIKDVQAT